MLFEKTYLNKAIFLPLEIISSRFEVLPERVQKNNAARLSNATGCLSESSAGQRYVRESGFPLFLLHEHGVPGGELYGFLLGEFQYLGGDVLLVDDDAEHVFVEPLVGHDEVAAVTV